MTFPISSALASQTASRTAALEILQKLGKRPTNLTDTQFKKHHDHILIEHWWVGVRISIKPFWEVGNQVIESTFHKGLSTIISWKEFAKRLWQRATEKATNIKSQRLSDTKFKVEGKQSKSGWWEVTANPTGLTCNCWLYKCQFNRLILNQECEPLKKAIASNQAQVKELFNQETGGLEKSIQIVCHHIKAVMINEFDCENISDYLLDYHEVNKAWKNRNWKNRNNWGKLGFNIPAPKPEIPIGSYLQRTDDWMSLEYRVWIHCRKTRLTEGEIPWTTKGIGRIVEQDGIVAYRPNSGMGQIFNSKYDAIAYLIRNAGYTLEQVAEAYQLKQSA